MTNALEAAKRIYGGVPEGYEVKHLNGNVNDNKEGNLTLVRPAGQGKQYHTVMQYGDELIDVGMTDTWEEGAAIAQGLGQRMDLAKRQGSVDER